MVKLKMGDNYIICSKCRQKLCTVDELIIVKERRENDITLHSYVDLNAMSRICSLTYMKNFLVQESVDIDENFVSNSLWLKVNHKCNGFIGHINTEIN